MTISRLVTLAKQIATSPEFTHTPHGVRQIVEAISHVTAFGLGLDTHPYNKRNSPQTPNSRGHKQIRTRQEPEPGLILYQHIYEDEHVSVGIFLLPKGASLPLHDHPSMSVVSLGLFGSCHHTSFDWKDQSTRDDDQGEALLVEDRVFRAGEVVTCHPTSHGNIHSLEALENFAMLDVLIPPYSDDRNCRYFDVSTSPSGTPWLTRVPDPVLRLEHEMYLGPPIDFTKMFSLLHHHHVNANPTNPTGTSTAIAAGTPASQMHYVDEAK